MTQDTKKAIAEHRISKLHLGDLGTDTLHLLWRDLSKYGHLKLYEPTCAAILAEFEKRRERGEVTDKPSD